MNDEVVLHAPIARRFPAPADAPADLVHSETHIFRVRAAEVPSGIPDDANPREPSDLNRQVYRRVNASLLGTDGEGVGSFHLKHGGIVVVAEKVEKLPDDRYRLHFNPAVKQGVANGNHSYRLILDAQDTDDGIPPNQYVEIKVHTGVPAEVVPDLAEGLNTSMQVREESLADLRDQFNWLKETLGKHPNGLQSVAWREGDEGEYEVREVIALLMALDRTRFPVEDPIGIENTYARLSSIFRAYLSDPSRVECFRGIALQALELYEYIRFSAVTLWDGRFRSATTIADRKKSSEFVFPFLIDPKTKQPRRSDVRLKKAATIPCFAAFRTLVDVPGDGGDATWRYEFADVKGLWGEHGPELLREVYEAVNRQHNGNVHYAGRSPMLYRATTKTLELADLRRRLAG